MEISSVWRQYKLRQYMDINNCDLITKFKNMKPTDEKRTGCER